MTFWGGVLLFAVLWVVMFVVGVLVVCVLIALDLGDPRAWWAERKCRRLTQLPPATARQIKRSRLANRAELDAIQMPLLARVPRARSDFDEGSTQ